MKVYCAFLLALTISSIVFSVRVLSEIDLIATSAVAVIEFGLLRARLFAYLIRGESGALLKVGDKETQLKSPAPWLTKAAVIALSSSKIRLYVYVSALDYYAGALSVGLAATEQAIKRAGDIEIIIRHNDRCNKGEVDISLTVSVSLIGIIKGLMRTARKKVKRSV
jgi:hypothetical protein